MWTRYHDPRVIPIEVWDLLVDGSPLYRFERNATFGGALAKAAEALIAGTAQTESGTPFPPECRSIGSVVLTGGGAKDVRWKANAIPARNIPQDFPGERGGFELLARIGSANGIVVDLGQRRLKVSHANHRTMVERNFNAIPISSRPTEALGRDALVAWVAATLLPITTASKPDGVVLALPCAITSEGVVDTCSYPWTKGDTIVNDLLNASSLTNVPTWIVNDAELAAIGLLAESRSSNATLVLTIGHGVGAALILGEP